MADRQLRFTLRTPHLVVVDRTARSVRVLTGTGHVGLRPGMEPLVLAIEAGLIVLRDAQAASFAGSAGGLLSFDGHHATLYTPLAVAGTDPAAVRTALDEALARPGAEQKVRAVLDRLEGRILTELRTQRPAARAQGARR